MNLKSLFNKGLLIGLLAVLPASLFGSQILVVDLSSLVESYYKTKPELDAIRADFEESSAALQPQIDEVQELRKNAEKADELAKSPVHSDAARANYEKQAQIAVQQFLVKQRELQQKAQEWNRIFEQRQISTLSALYTEVARKASEVAKSKGALILLDRSVNPAQQTPVALPGLGSIHGMSNVLYFDSSIDITEEVRAVLNAEAPKQP